MYHYVCPSKYRRIVLSESVDITIKEVCLEIEKHYEIKFLEIGTDKDHVHFLLQSVPTQSPTQIIKMLKSIIARKVFIKHPEVKKQLWGGAFWSSGYYVNTVSKFGNETTISQYVRDQGIEKDYKVLHKSEQLTLF